MCHLLDESVRLCVYVYMLVHVNMVALPTAYSLFTLCLLPYSTRARTSCHTDDAMHSLFSLLHVIIGMLVPCFVPYRDWGSKG